MAIRSSNPFMTNALLDNNCQRGHFYLVKTGHFYSGLTESLSDDSDPPPSTPNRNHAETSESRQNVGIIFPSLPTIAWTMRRSCNRTPDLPLANAGPEMYDNNRPKFTPSLPAARFCHAVRSGTAPHGPMPFKWFRLLVPDRAGVHFQLRLDPRRRPARTDSIRPRHSAHLSGTLPQLPRP